MLVVSVLAARMRMCASESDSMEYSRL